LIEDNTTLIIVIGNYIIQYYIVDMKITIGQKLSIITVSIISITLLIIKLFLNKNKSLMIKNEISALNDYESSIGYNNIETESVVEPYNKTENNLVP
jgi:hypothetical protein